MPLARWVWLCSIVGVVMMIVQVAQTHTTPVTVCWGVWSPYSEEEMEDVAVELKSGIGYQVTNVPCSAHSICYEVSELLVH